MSLVQIFDPRVFHTTWLLFNVYIEKDPCANYKSLAFPYYIATFKRIYRKKTLMQFFIPSFSILRGYFSTYI